jgi:hypothetical protein
MKKIAFDYFEIKQNELLKLKENDTGRPINPVWEAAREFCNYLNLNEKSIKFILYLFKLYGQEKVLSLKSWLKDLEAVKKKELAGLIVWKLRENEKSKLNNT